MVASGVRDSSNSRVMHHHSVLVRLAVDREWDTYSEKIYVYMIIYAYVCILHITLYLICTL